MRAMRTRIARTVAALATVALVAAACGGGEDLDEGTGTTETSAGAAVDLSGETVEVAATWTGAEQERFEMVLDGFAEQTGATVRFRSAGRRHRRVPRPAHRGWRPARRGDPAAARRGADLRRSRATCSRSKTSPARRSTRTSARTAREVGSVDGTLYGVWFKAAQKSTVWYNVNVFEGAGVEPPATWEELQQVAQTISDYGVPPYSIGADVGWPLSDLFENIYLRTAGPDMYDQLAAHEIPWTDQSVKDALSVMADIFGGARPSRRRHDRRGADRLQRLGHPGVRRPARGSPDLRGRLRRRRHQR